MSELIDRTVLKSRMYTEAFESDTNMQRWDSGCWIRYKLFEKVVDNMPTVPYSPRWHKVEDELPDKYTQCLVADSDGKCAVGYYRYDCEAWDNPAFGWIEMENRIYIDDIPMGIGKVVAWMPIEPPKEDA